MKKNVDKIVKMTDKEIAVSLSVLLVADALRSSGLPPELRPPHRAHSPEIFRHALIRQIFGTKDENRAICVDLLYALSIIVRHRPSIWRRVQEGELDHMRALIEAFLTVVDRVLPEQFLEKVTGQRVFAKQPGSFF